MKKIIQYILRRLRYRVVKETFYKHLINISTESELNFYYLFKKNIKEGQDICCLDIGANIGQTAKRMRAYFPNAAIYCFEPVKNTYKELIENLAGYSNIRTYNFAMGANKGDLEISHREHSEWNSLVKQPNEDDSQRDCTTEFVKIDTVDDFVKEEGITKIDILKSDTEGFEMEVLKGAKNSLEKRLIKTVYIEVGFSKADVQHCYWIEVAQELEKYGYHFSGLFEKSYGPDMLLTYANALFCSSENGIIQ
jgi:FkbM family methyltransferase